MLTNNKKLVLLLKSQASFSHWATVGYCEYCEHTMKAERDERDIKVHLQKTMSAKEKETQEILNSVGPIYGLDISLCQVNRW